MGRVRRRQPIKKDENVIPAERHRHKVIDRPKRRLNIRRIGQSYDSNSDVKEPSNAEPSANTTTTDANPGANTNTDASTNANADAGTTTANADADAAGADAAGASATVNVKMRRGRRIVEKKRRVRQVHRSVASKNKIVKLEYNPNIDGLTLLGLDPSSIDLSIFTSVDPEKLEDREALIEQLETLKFRFNEKYKETKDKAFKTRLNDVSEFLATVKEVDAKMKCEDDIKQRKKIIRKFHKTVKKMEDKTFMKIIRIIPIGEDTKNEVTTVTRSNGKKLYKNAKYRQAPERHEKKIKRLLKVTQEMPEEFVEQLKDRHASVYLEQKIRSTDKHFYDYQRYDINQI